MTDRSSLTVARAAEVLNYNPHTGVFVWKIYRGGRSKIGEVAGYVKTSGYIEIRIDGNPYYGHRLAWLLSYGAWPEFEIDHANGNRSDNCIKNLRAATRRQNARNSGLRRNNKSGFKGVHWVNRNKKWQARITIAGKRRHLGFFSDKVEAHKRYCEAATRHYGEFANFGKITPHHNKMKDMHDGK